MNIYKLISTIIIVSLLTQDVAWASPSVSNLQPRSAIPDQGFIREFIDAYTGKVLTDEDRRRIREFMAGIVDLEVRRMVGEIFGLEVPDVDIPEGLCVTGDTVLPLLVIRYSLLDRVPTRIVNVKPGDYVLSLNEETQQIEPHRINGLLDMGIKPVYRLTTVSGRSIKTTVNHPYLTRQGWVKVGWLREGQEIAVPSGHALPLLYGDDLGTLRLIQKQEISKPLIALTWLFTSFIYWLNKNTPYKENQAYNGQSNFQNQWKFLKEITSQSDGKDCLSQISYNFSNKFSSNFTNPNHYKNEYITLISRLSRLLSIPELEAAEIGRDILWDRIVSIEYVGLEHVYDIEVEGTHNFIGNGIFAHNTYIKKPTSEITVDIGEVREEDAKEGEILKLIRNIQEAEYRVRLVDGKVQEVVLISANIPKEYEPQLKEFMQERLKDAFNKLLERENFLPRLEKAPQDIIVRFHTQTTEEGQMRLGRIPEFLPHNTQGLVELHPLALLSSLLLQYGLRHELDHAWHVYPIGIEVDLPLEEGRVIMNDRSFFETLTKEEQEELLSHLSPENLNGVDMGGVVYKELYKIYSRPREKPDEKFSFQSKEPTVVFNRKGHRFAYRYIDEDNPIEMILGDQMIRIIKSDGELIFITYHLNDMSQPAVEFKVDTDRTIKIGRHKESVGIVRDEAGREVGHEAVFNDIDLPLSNDVVSRRHIKLTIEDIKGKRTRIIFEDLTSRNGTRLYSYGQAVRSVQPKILIGVVKKEEDALTLKKKEMNKIVKQLNFRIDLSDEGWKDRVREEFIKERDRLMQGLSRDEGRNFEEEYSDRFLNIWVENLKAFKEYILFLREMKINLVIRRKGEITDTFRQLVQRQVKMLRRIPIGLLAKAREFFPYVISEEQEEMQKDGRLLGFKKRGTHGTVMLRNEGFRGSTIFSSGSLGGSRGASVILSASELGEEGEGRRSEMAVSPETSCAHELYHHLHLEEGAMPVMDFIEMLKIAERKYWWHSSMFKTGKSGHTSDVVRIIEEALAQDEEKGKEAMLVVCQEYFMLHSTFYTPAEVVSFCLSHDIGAEKELGSQRFHQIRQIGYRKMLRSEKPVANRQIPLYEIYTFRENRHWIDYGDEKGNILIYGNRVIRNDTHKLDENDRRAIEEAVKYKFVETICRDPALGGALKDYIKLLAGIIRGPEAQVFFMDDMEVVLGPVENREQIFKIHRYINDAIYTAGYQISFRDRYEILNRLFKDFNPPPSVDSRSSLSGVLAAIVFAVSLFGSNIALAIYPPPTRPPVTLKELVRTRQLDPEVKLKVAWDIIRDVEPEIHDRYSKVPVELDPGLVDAIAATNAGEMDVPPRIVVSTPWMEGRLDRKEPKTALYVAMVLRHEVQHIIDAEGVTNIFKWWWAMHKLMFGGEERAFDREQGLLDRYDKKYNLGIDRSLYQRYDILIDTRYHLGYFWTKIALGAIDLFILCTIIWGIWRVFLRKRFGDKFRQMIERLIDRLERWGGDDNGYIQQGEESRKEFESKRSEIEKNDITDQYKNKLLELIGQVEMQDELRRRIETIRIYGFNSIVKGKDDFFLGYYDTNENKLFLAADLINVLGIRGPPSLVDEYLLHEVICPVLGHYEAIKEQRGIFPAHYIERPDKGLLGSALRGWINYNIFLGYWNENFVRPKRRNFFHAMVNGLAYVGESYKKDIKIRMYPEEDGIVGVLIIDSQIKLSIRYTLGKGVELYPLSEETLKVRSGKEYDWDWLEERFTLKRIRKVLSLDKAIGKVANLRRIYEGYIEKLGITPEEERRLRSNLATASYCCVIKNKVPYDVIDIYLKALGTSKEGLDLDTKKQLIIATYEVAMTGNHESLKRVIRQYSAVLGKDIPERLRLKWIIATYEVAMKGRHESLKKVIRLYRAVLGKDIPEELKDQWLTATYKVAMKGNHESLRSVIRQYRTVLGKDIPDRLKAKWLIASYEVAMNGQHESLRRVIRLYKSVLGRNITDGLKSHWLTATYVSAMYGRHESLKKVIRLYRAVLGKNIPEELKAKWLVASSHVAARGKQESLKKVIRLYSKALGGIIPDELKGIWLTATYRIARNDNDISLKEVIKIYRSVLGEVIPSGLKRKWLVATYAVAAKGEQESLKEVIRLYRKVLGTIPDGLKGQWLTATYDVAKNGNHGSLEKVIRLYESVLGTNIPDELKGKWLTATSRVAMDGNHNLLEEVIRQYRLVLGETIPSGLKEKWLIATYIVVINGKPELLNEILLALREHGIFNTDDLVLKGAILIITSLIIQLPDPIAEVRRFIGSFIGITDMAKRKKAITDYRRGLYKRVVLRMEIESDIQEAEPDNTAHMEGLKLKNGRDGLWIKRSWFNSGQEVDLSVEKMEEYKGEVIRRSGYQEIRLKNGRVIKVVYDLEGKDEVKDILRQQIDMMAEEEQAKLPGQIVVSLLQGSTHPFEDCKGNGFIGINEQVSSHRLLHLGLRHELAHEAGSTKMEDELLMEDIVESVVIGISDEELAGTDIFMEDSGLISTRRSLYLSGISSEGVKGDVISHLQKPDASSSREACEPLVWVQWTDFKGRIRFNWGDEKGKKQARLATGIMGKGLVKVRRLYDEELGEWLYETEREIGGRKIIQKARLVRKEGYWGFYQIRRIGEIKDKVVEQLLSEEPQSREFEHLEWEDKADREGAIYFVWSHDGRKKKAALYSGIMRRGPVNVRRFYDEELDEWVYETRRTVEGRLILNQSRLVRKGGHWAFEAFDRNKSRVVAQLRSVDAQSRDAFKPFEWLESANIHGQISFVWTDEGGKKRIVLSTGNNKRGTVKVKRFFDEGLNEWVYETEREIGERKIIQRSRLVRQDGYWGFRIISRLKKEKGVEVKVKIRGERPGKPVDSVKMAKRKVVKQLRSEDAQSRDAFEPLEWEQETDGIGKVKFFWIHKGIKGQASLSTGTLKRGFVKVRRFYDEELGEWVYETEREIDGGKYTQQSRLVRREANWGFEGFDRYKEKVIAQLRSKDAKSRNAFQPIEWEQKTDKHGSVFFNWTVDGRHIIVGLSTGVREIGLVRIRRFFDEERQEWVYETKREVDGKIIVRLHRLVDKGAYLGFRQMKLKGYLSPGLIEKALWEREMRGLQNDVWSLLNGKKPDLSLLEAARRFGVRLPEVTILDIEFNREAEVASVRLPGEEGYIWKGKSKEDVLKDLDILIDGGRKMLKGLEEGPRINKIQRQIVILSRLRDYIMVRPTEDSPLSELLGLKSPNNIPRNEVTGEGFPLKYLEINDEEIELDPFQSHAVRLALHPNTKLAMILGGAGSGKTKTMVEVVRQFVARGKRVLVVSRTNLAVDNLLLRLDNFQVPILRAYNRGDEDIGDDRIHPGLRRYGVRDRNKRGGIYDSKGFEEFDRRVKISRGGYVVGVTVDSMIQVPETTDRDYDVVVIDEAGTLNELETILATLKARERLILAGDHKQLAPFYDEDRMKGQVRLYKSAMKESGMAKRWDSGYSQVFLARNYRSHPVLAILIGRLIYERLMVPNIWRMMEEDTIRIVDVPMKGVLGNEEPVGTSFQNPREAEAAVTEFNRAYRSGYRPEQITILTGYRAQVDLIRSMLKKYLLSIGFGEIKAKELSQSQVNTVDSYQGQENSVIIYSFVRSNPVPNNVGHIGDLNRLNVALSRSKDRLVVVGDLNTLNNASYTKQDRLFAELFRNLQDILRDFDEFWSEQLAKGYYTLREAIQKRNGLLGREIGETEGTSVVWGIIEKIEAILLDEEVYQLLEVLHESVLGGQEEIRLVEDEYEEYRLRALNILDRLPKEILEFDAEDDVFTLKWLVDKGNSPVKIRLSKIEIEEDVVISSERTKKGHAEYHRQGRFKEVIREIAMELGLTADNNGRYDLRKAGSQIRTSHGELRIEPDGILVIIDSRFKKDHAGRRQMAVYARNEQKARHELAELRAWIGYAKKELGMTDRGIRNGSLNRWMQDKRNIKKVRELHREFHKKGIEAERQFNIPFAEVNARVEEGILRIDGLVYNEDIQRAISNLQKSFSSRKDIRSILGLISPFKIRFLTNASSPVRIYKEGDGYIMELDIVSFSDWGIFGVPKKLLMAELRRVTASMILDFVETDIPRDFLLDIILILLDSQDINRRYRSGNRKVIAKRSRKEYLQRLRHDKGRQYVTLIKRLSHTPNLEEKVRLIYLYLKGKEKDEELLKLQDFFTQNRGILIRMRLAYNRLERKVRIEPAPEESVTVIASPDRIGAKQSGTHKRDFGGPESLLDMPLYVFIILWISILSLLSFLSLGPIRAKAEEKPLPPLVSPPVREGPRPQPESFEHTVIPRIPDDCLAHIARKYYAVSSRRIERYIAGYNNRNNPDYKVKDIDIIIDGRRIVLPYRIVHKVRGKNVKMKQVARMYNLSEGYLRAMNPWIPLDGRLRRGDEIEIAVRIETTHIVHAEGFRLKNGKDGLWVNGEDISIGDGVDRRKEVIRMAKKNKPDYTIAGKKVYLSNELITRLRDTDINWLEGFLDERFEDSLPIVDEIFIDLLNDSLHLFEDCKENGYIGINEQLLRIQDSGFKVKLLKVGIAHELKHEVGTTKNEEELLIEDVIESVNVGMSNGEVQDLAKAGILEEDCGFFKTRGILDTLWEINILHNDLRADADVIVGLYKDYPDKKRVLEIIKKYVLIPAQGIQVERYRDLVLSDIYKAIAVLYQNEKDRRVALDVIEREAIIPAKGIRDKRIRARTLKSINEVITALSQDGRKEPPVRAQSPRDESYAISAYSRITGRMLYIKDVPDISLADFVFGIDSILSVLAQLDSFDHFEFEVLPLDISIAYSLASNPFLRLRSSYLKRRVVEGRYSLRERIRALLLNHSNEIVSYTTDVVKGYGDSIGKYLGWGNRYILGGLVSLETKIGKKGYRVSELIRELGISGLKKQEIVRILKELGYGIHRGYIVTSINLVTSVYRGSAEIDHAESRYVTHSITTALCRYARMGGEATRGREEKLVSIGNKALHEVDYALMCYEGVNTRTADENVALAFSYAGALPQYSRKRTVVIEDKSALVGLEEIREKQEKERLYEADIMRLLTQVIKGEAIDTDIDRIEETITGIKEILNEYYFLAVYGYMDSEFFSKLKQNPKLFNKLSIEAMKRQLAELEKRTEQPARYKEFLGDLRKRNVLWGHKGLNLLGYLEFKVKMRKGTYEERDVEGHFPTWQLAGVLDNLRDSAKSFKLREAFIKLIKEDGEITKEELEILVGHIKNVMVAIDHLTVKLGDEEKREAITRIALYLSIEEIRRVNELEKRPKGDIRRYFYQKTEVARRLGVNPEDIESINPSSTDVAVVINKYFRDKKERQEVAGKVVDVVTRYLLNQLEVDKKTSDSIERIIRSKNIEILTPLPIVVEVSGKIILQDLSVYLSGNQEWDRENLDNMAVGVIRDLTSGNQQVMAYTEKTQKERFIRLLEEKGVRELQDRLAFIDISQCSSYADIKRKVSERLGLSIDELNPRLISLVKVIDSRFESKDPKDRIIIAGHGGLVDIHLMWKVALILMQSEGDIRSSLKAFLEEYYKGTEYEGKIENLVEEMFKMGVYIVLPPIVPFMRDYYDAQSTIDRSA